MQIWNHYFVGVADIWLMLLANCSLLAWLTARLWRSWTSRQPAGQWIRRMARDESGATYLLPLVLVMPFYVLLIAMIVECTLMLTQKIGSVGAAYASARAAAVWLPYESAMPKEAPDYTPLQHRQAMVRLAAARAMWPYASGAKAHASSEPMGEFIEATAEQQIEAFQAYANDSQFDKAYLKRKFAYAYNASTVEVVYLDPVTLAPTDNPAFNAKIQLTLRYEAPIHTYGVGRLFGEKSQFGNYYVRPVVTTVTLENEGVKVAEDKRVSATKAGKSKSLGIKYYDRYQGTANTTFATNKPSPNAVVSKPQGSIYRTAEEYQRGQESLRELERQYAQANANDRPRIQDLINDFRVALGLENGRPYTGDVSWSETPNVPVVRGPWFRVYVLEDRLSAFLVNGSRGRTFVEDVRTGEVYLYQHASIGGETLADVDVDRNPLPASVAYAELQGDMFVEGFDPTTSMGISTGIEQSAGVLFGSVVQDGPNGSTLRGVQGGAVAGASVSLGITAYSYSGSYPSLQSAGYSPLWSRRHEEIQMIPAPN